MSNPPSPARFSALVAIAIMAACCDANAAVVNLQAGPRWCVVTNTSTTLSWDWNWEWIPANVAKAHVVVAGGRNGVVANETVAKPATSVAVILPEPTAQTEDVYAVTLEFTDGEDNVLAARTAQLDVLCGAFADVGVQVKTWPLSSRRWERVGGRTAIVPYASGYAVERGEGRELLEYFVEGEEIPRFSQYVDFSIPGFTIMVW